MYKIYDEGRPEKEVVRISIAHEENFDNNVGKTASYIIKALVFENKDVYIKFISSTKKLADISLKTQKMLIILNRMIKEGLESKFGLDVPAEYRNKKMEILQTLPYVKKTELFSTQVNPDGTKTKVVTELNDGFEPKATIVRLLLAEKL